MSSKFNRLKEDGYASFSNKFMLSLVQSDLTMTELKIMLLVSSQAYKQGTSYFKYDCKTLVEALGVKKSNISAAKKNLIKKGLLIHIEKKYYKIKFNESNIDDDIFNALFKYDEKAIDLQHKEDEKVISTDNISDKKLCADITNEDKKVMPTHNFHTPKVMRTHNFSKSILNIKTKKKEGNKISPHSLLVSKIFENYKRHKGITRYGISDERKQLVETRIREALDNGFTENDILTMLEVKATKGFMAMEKGRSAYTIETLFGKNFLSYLEESQTSKPVLKKNPFEGLPFT